ncbi:hypothetical protein C0J52_16072 [Blattella germanica]|nr:hypothetical protein C0J52_16072 [Blattella germanica]
MTPFRNPGTQEERAYNLCFTKERVIIERCFGQVKQRFPILGNKIRLETRKVPSVILSCFVLHNVAKYLGDEDFGVVDADGDMNQEEENILNEEGQLVRQRGQERRRRIATIIHNNVH